MPQLPRADRPVPRESVRAAQGCARAAVARAPGWAQRTVRGRVSIGPGRSRRARRPPRWRPESRARPRCAAWSPQTSLREVTLEARSALHLVDLGRAARCRALDGHTSGPAATDPRPAIAAPDAQHRAGATKRVAAGPRTGTHSHRCRAFFDQVGLRIEPTRGRAFCRARARRASAACRAVSPVADMRWAIIPDTIGVANEVPDHCAMPCLNSCTSPWWGG